MLVSMKDAGSTVAACGVELLIARRVFLIEQSDLNRGADSALLVGNIREKSVIERDRP
jgi:hypothetical protein